jgi:hypothetical protein
VGIRRNGTVMVTDWVLCCAVRTGDRSQAGSYTAVAEPPGSQYFLIRAESFKAIEVSMSGLYSFNSA